MTNDKIENQGIEFDELKKEIEKFGLEDILRRIEFLEVRIKERDKISEEYLSGKKITGTTHAAAGTESTHTHTLGKIPVMVFITPDSNGIVYLTEKTSAHIKVKASANSVDFTAYLLL